MDDEKQLQFKVVIMGDSSVGKTSIMQRFDQETFDFQMDTTIGASFLTKVIHIDDRQITLNIWDTAGQERYRSLIPTYARGADAAIICFDVSSHISFISLSRWIEELHKFCSDDTTMYIVGNKCDLEIVVPQNEAEHVAKQNNCQLMYTSAKSGIGITELFTDIASNLAKKELKEQMESIDLKTADPKKAEAKMNKSCCK